MEGLKEFFEELDRKVDKTGRWGSKSLYEILMVVMCGVAVGGKSILDILSIARCEEKWLKDKVKLSFPNGFSSYDTVRRVLGMINPLRLGRYGCTFDRDFRFKILFLS